MKELSIKEEKNLYGGGNISASLINALSKGVNTIMDVGRYLGSSIRKLFSHDLC